MLTFLEWVQQYQEGFMDCPQQSGDQVLFNVHSMADLQPPLDLAGMQDSMGMVQHTKGGNVFVSRPAKTRHRNMKKFMAKDGSGLLKLASGHLKQVPSELLMGGGDGTHKTYIYAPGEYHRGFLKRADRKMMAADAQTQTAAPQAQQAAAPQAQQALPAPPKPTGPPLNRIQTQPQTRQQQQPLPARYRYQNGM